MNRLNRVFIGFLLSLFIYLQLATQSKRRFGKYRRIKNAKKAEF